MSTRRTLTTLAAVAVATGTLGTCSYQQALRDAASHIPAPEQVTTIRDDLADRAAQAKGVLDDASAAVEDTTRALNEVMTAEPDQPVGDLAQAAAALPTRVADAPVPYDPDAFGQRWADTDRNGCDQRNDSLGTAMDPVTYRSGTRDCVVESGVLHDSYTGQSRDFVKSLDGGGVDIDHMVARAEAWHAGAWQWTTAEREAFANDLANLVATDAAVNRSKSDQDIAAWLPPDPAAVCAFTSSVITIYDHYSLNPTPTARDRMVDLATQCAQEDQR